MLKILNTYLCNPLKLRFFFLLAFRSWEPPKFPINGLDLKEHGVNRGQFIGYCLDNLKLAWIESDFTLEKDQLLSETLKKVVDNYQEPPKRKKK